MKVPAARERGASVSSTSSTSSSSSPKQVKTQVISIAVLIRPTIDAILLVLVLPLVLLIVVLVPWGEVDMSSPHLQLLGIALMFASVLLCLRLVCAACPSRDDDSTSRGDSQQSLLSSTEDVPPNYESIMADYPPENLRSNNWFLTVIPAAVQVQRDPPPYHAVAIEHEEEGLH